MSSRPNKRDKPSVRPTRLGLHLIFIAIFTMVGGAIRGFNLLLLLSGLLVGALLIQWRYSRWFTESIGIGRELVSEAFAGTPFRITFRVRNLSRWLPLWAIRIDETIRFHDSSACTSGSCAVGVVPPNSTQLTGLDCKIANRGEYRFGPVRAVSTFPFSLFAGNLKIRDESTLLVFPRPLQLKKGWQTILRTNQGDAADSARRVGPSNGEFFGLREWQSGDNLRWIHHRTTARIGEPIVRQFEQQLSVDANVLVDCYGPSETPDPDDPAEQAIEFAASVLMNHIEDNSSRISLAVADIGASVSSAGSCRKGKAEALTKLAKARLSPAPKIVDALDLLLSTGGISKHLVVISPRSLESVLQDDDHSIEERLRAWMRRRAFHWIDVTSPNFQFWVEFNAKS